MKGNTYRDGKVHVMSEECSTCIFRPGERFVSGSRVADLVRETKDEDGSTVTCHHTAHNPDVGDAICRGWFDRFSDRDPVIRFAKFMGIIEEDTEVPL